MSKKHGLANTIAESAGARSRTVLAVESVTAGRIAAALAAAPRASEWFRGSVVAYQTDFKRRVLGVQCQRIVSAECALELARGGLQLAESDFVVATTGVGGPDDEEGRPPGTVFVAVGSRSDLRVREHHFSGSPRAIVRAATVAALDDLRHAIEDER